MEISIAVYGILSALSVAEAFVQTKRAKTRMYVFGAALLILLAALRDFSVGPDTRQYLGRHGFLVIMTLPWRDVPIFKWEPGYTLLNKVVGTIYCNQRFLLIVVTLVALAPVLYRFFQESRWGTLALVSFYGMGLWQASSFLMRQGCAIAILSFSYRYCRERKFMPFLLCVVVAMSFHRTAVIWILLYFVYPLAISWQTLATCAVASVLCAGFGKKIFHLLQMFARNREHVGYNGGASMLVVLWLCVLTIFAMYKGKIPESSRLFYWMLLMAAVMQPIAFTFSNFARIIIYFRIALVALLPNTLYDFWGNFGDKRTIRVGKAVCGVLLCMVLFVWYAGEMVPYRFCF